MEYKDFKENYRIVIPQSADGHIINTRIALPKTLKSAEISYPVFSKVPGKPYQYKKELRKISVVQFFCKHHPAGYTSAKEKYGDGSEKNPFLDFKNACEKVDCFSQNTCGIKTQLVIMNGSSPLDSECSYEFSIPRRVIIGSTDGVTYFNVSGEIRLKACLISQCNGVEGKTSRLHSYAESYTNLQESRFVVRDRGIGNKNKMRVAHPYDNLTLFLGFVPGYDIALSFDSFFIGRVKQDMPTFRDGGIVGYFYSPKKAEEVVYENEELFEWSFSPYGGSVSFPSCLISLQGDDFLVSWINGSSNIFKKKSKDTWECEKPLYTPDLRICKNAKITSRSAGYYTYYTMTATWIIKRIPGEEWITKDAVWHLMKRNSDNALQKSTGEIIEIKEDGKLGKVLAVADVFDHTESDPYVIYRAKSVGCLADILSECFYNEWSKDIHCNIAHNCRFEKSPDSYYNDAVRIADECVYSEWDSMPREALSRSSFTIAKDESISLPDVISHSTVNVKTIGESFVDTIENSSITSTDALKSIYGQELITVKNLINSSITVTLKEHKKSIDAVVIQSDGVVSNSNVILKGTTVYGGYHTAISLPSNAAVSGLTAECSVSIQADGDDCIESYCCDIMQDNKCISGYSYSRVGDCDDEDDD